jgi:1-acyl-sn-glycerol-3-phosphate acyltransferase
MGRRVLGNDPFQRGAAQRTPETAAGAETRGSDTEAAEPAVPTASKPNGRPARPRVARGDRVAKGQPRAKPPRRPEVAASAMPPEPASSPQPRATEPHRPHVVATPVVAGEAASSPQPGPTHPPAATSVLPPEPARSAQSGSASSSAEGDLVLPGARDASERGEASAPSALPPAAVVGLLEALKNAPALLAELWAALEAAMRAFRAGLGTSGDEQLDIYGRDPRLSEAVAPLVEFLYSRWFRVEVEGAEHIPAGGALLVANHSGALPLDGPMLHEALRRERRDLPEARWLAEDQVFYAPLLGTLFNRLGAVRASPDSATRLLAEGRPVCIFPEGIQGIGKPFAERYRLKRFGRGGFVKLALRTGKPILPVAIVGAEEALPLLGKLPGQFLGIPYLPVTPLGPIPLPAKWHLRIGRPLPVPQGASDTALAVVESMVDATRTTIEEMLKELLLARRSIFLG